MSVKTRAELKSENASDFPDNVSQLISPADLRGQMDDVADSAILSEDLAGLGLAANVVSVSATSYSLTAADHGALLYFTNIDPVLVLVPADLPANFSCRLAQGGGQVTLIPATEVTIHSPNSKYTSARQYVVLSLVAVRERFYLLSGETTDAPAIEDGDAPVNTELPSISLSGSRLTADVGLWSGDPNEFFFQWNRGAAQIEGAEAQTYSPTDDDIGSFLTVTVTAYNSVSDIPGVATSLPYGPITGALPANIVLPTIVGGASPLVGQTLTALPGTWTGAPTPTFTYQWKSAGTAVAGAIAPAYQITLNDLTDTITVTVTATNSQGQAVATSAATAAVGANPDATAPILSLFNVVTSGEGAALLEVTTNEGNGIFYWIVVNDGAAVPSAAQIRAGTDGAGNPAVSAGSIEVAGIETWGNNPSGLSAGTVYDAYGVMYDNGGLASNVVSDTFTSAGSSVPTLSTQSAADYADTFVVLQTTTNNGNGTLYTVVVPSSAAPPSNAQIKAGQDSTGAAAPAANQVLTTPGTKTLLVRGLTQATAYRAYFVQEVTAGFSNKPDAYFVTDTLVLAFITSGTATGITAGGTTFTSAQPDPAGGNNAIKWADIGDDFEAASVTASFAIPAFYNGINKYHLSAKHAGGAEWQRFMHANIALPAGAVAGLVPCNVLTGAFGNSTMAIAPKSYAIGSGWLLFSLAADLTGGTDLNGAVTLYMGDIANTTGVDIRDGTNIRYLHDLRITRPTL